MDGGLGLDGMFGGAGDDDEGVTEVTRQVSQRVGPEASVAPGATSERLRVAEFGAEEFWHGRWDGEGDAHEWFTVDAGALWPVLQPLAAQLGLARPIEGGEPPRIVELGCGLSRLSLDLALHHGLQGIVATDLVPRCVEVGRAAAAKEGLGPPVLDFRVEDALATSFADGAFALVLDKGCADVFALSDDATALQRYAKEAARLTAAGGFCVLVTAWTAERRAERLRLFAGLSHVSTTMVHSHGPAAEHMVVLRRES